MLTPFQRVGSVTVILCLRKRTIGFLLRPRNPSSDIEYTVGDTHTWCETVIRVQYQISPTVAFGSRNGYELSPASVNLHSSQPKSGLSLPGSTSRSRASISGNVLCTSILVRRPHLSHLRRQLHGRRFRPCLLFPATAITAALPALMPFDVSSREGAHPRCRQYRRLRGARHGRGVAQILYQDVRHLKLPGVLWCARRSCRVILWP